MKTNNIYVGSLNVITDVKVVYISDFEEHITTRSEGVEFVLVKSKKNVFGKLIMKDLNTNKRYGISVPSKIGKIYIPPKSLTQLNIFYKDLELNMPKTKVKELGNKVIKGLYKIQKEKE